LSAVLTATLGNDRFPVDVEQLTIEYPRQVFDDPLTRVVGEPLEGFENALFPSPSGKPCWLIAYRTSPSSEGADHYLLRRGPGQSIRRRARNMLIRDPALNGARRRPPVRLLPFELLMPMDESRRQVDGRPVDLDLPSLCAGRYGVSLTAAAETPRSPGVVLP
jgi:hypothetical protein